MKKGFTLTELIVTIVLLAVLSSIAIPGFSKTAEKAAVTQAVAYLRMIKAGEQMYFSKNGVYIACTTKAALKTSLGVEVTEEKFKFNVTLPTTTSFTARALKGSAAPTNCTDANAICVSDQGVWTGGATYATLITKLNA